jgi:SagB-type dehydrogenase family enzyme
MDTFDMQALRKFLKGDLWESWGNLDTDQRLGIPRPPVEEPAPEEAQRYSLVPPEDFTVGTMPLIETIRRRRSQRDYTGEPLTFEELSFILWATQGVSRILGGGQTVLRTVPSAGARHPFESYLLINQVADLPDGLYRYLSVSHELCFLDDREDLVERAYGASYDQYVQDCAVVFIWAAIPYRTEWRYGPLAHKMVAVDAGHMCQNLYLACEALGVGACAIGAYRQAEMDDLIGVDGQEVFSIYLATVGRVGG